MALMVTGPGKKAQNLVARSEYGASSVCLDKGTEILPMPLTLFHEMSHL